VRLKGLAGHQDSLLPQVADHFHSFLELVDRQVFDLGLGRVGGDELLNGCQGQYILGIGLRHRVGLHDLRVGLHNLRVGPQDLRVGPTTSVSACSSSPEVSR
jgi:hypothetical protein